jgi:diacylglycerol kinase family enzyme
VLILYGELTSLGCCSLSLDKSEQKNIEVGRENDVSVWKRAMRCVIDGEPLRAAPLSLLELIASQDSLFIFRMITCIQSNTIIC